MRPPGLIAAFIGAALALGALEAPRALAQESLARASATHFTAEEAARFSKQIERDLATRGARVAMVFRTGRPREQLPDGMRYTHGAFWVYRDIDTTTGERIRGYAAYNLYAGDGRNWSEVESRLVQDWPLDMTLSSAVDDVGVIIPSPELQRRLLAVIDSHTYARLHNPAYSLVANPKADRYQNCTTFMLDVMAAAVWETDDKAKIRANVVQWFTPSIVPANMFVRLFGPIADPRLRTGDQRGPIQTATYESLAAFLQRYDMLDASYSLTYRRGLEPGPARLVQDD